MPAGSSCRWLLLLRRRFVAAATWLLASQLAEAVSRRPIGRRGRC